MLGKIRLPDDTIATLDGNGWHAGTEMDTAELNYRFPLVPDGSPGILFPLGYFAVHNAATAMRAEILLAPECELDVEIPGEGPVLH